jgi:hypothetical protein
MAINAASTPAKTVFVPAYGTSTPAKTVFVPANGAFTATEGVVAGTNATLAGCNSASIDSSTASAGSINVEASSLAPRVGVSIASRTLHAAMKTPAGHDLQCPAAFMSALRCQLSVLHLRPHALAAALARCATAVS